MCVPTFRDCPTNMVAVNDAVNYPNSTAFFYNNTDSPILAQGFVSVMACVTVDGYGYNGRVSQPCDTGSYNSKDTRDVCTKCPYGFTTAGVGLGYNSSDCGVAAGFGYHNTSTVFAVVPCPIGTYNNVSWSSNDTTECTPCPTGLTTEKEGSDSPLQCNSKCWCSAIATWLADGWLCTGECKGRWCPCKSFAEAAWVCLWKTTSPIGTLFIQQRLMYHACSALPCSVRGWIWRHRLRQPVWWHRKQCNCK